MGFEDLFGGGDKDYNDLLFTIDIGTANVQELIETSALVPEPKEVLLLMIFSLCLVKFLKDTQSLDVKEITS